MEDKRITNKNWKDHYDLFEKCYDCEIDCGSCELNHNALIKLAELEDKIENGTLIEFPRIHMREGLTFPYRVEYVDEYGDVEYDVYKTKEEAEEKLKELQSKE